MNPVIRRFLLPAVLPVIVASTIALVAQEPQPPPPDPPEDPIVFGVATPANLQAASCDGNGVVVHYPEPLVLSDCTDAPVVICAPPSGSLFPPGTTRVDCSITNSCGESTNVFFSVIVEVDAAPPQIICPTGIVAYATSAEGARVDYPLPAVTDDADPSPQLECDPPPGSLFPIGVTSVSCVVTDACGKVATCSFDVEVRRPEMQIQLDRPIGASPTVKVTAVGYDGMDVAAALDEEWLPLPNSQWEEPLGFATNKFWRPPVIDGAIRAPQGGEVAYVMVGLLSAYFNPGVNPARGIGDNSTLFGSKIHSGDAGGSGNRWSGEVNMPFTFHFFGRPYKKFRVSKNGLLTFSTNIVTGTEGLSYFNFAQNQTTNVMTNSLPLWNNGFAVDNTIFCMAGRYVTQTADDDVHAYLHGSSPYRQVWVIFRHPKDVYGRTVTGIVLEETSNRILLMDMDTDSPGDNTSRLLAGIQGESGSTREVRQVAAAPAMRLVASNGALADNGCYLFRPYVLGQPRTGQASSELLAATNLNLLITEQLRLANVPGATVAISRNGRLIFNRAYGFANVEKGEVMQPHHRACIGSVSKVIAAIGVEKLIQNGQLPGLNAWAYASDRLGKQWFWDGVNEALANGTYTNIGIIPNLTPANVSVTLNNLTNTTIRHLLSHTAALANRNDDVGAADAYAGGDYTQLTPQQQVRRFVATLPHITNGVGLISPYSNPSFKQIGVLIEEVAGQPFETWMMNNVMLPGGVPFARLMRTYEAEETWRDARRYHHYSANVPWVTSRITGNFGPPPYGDAIYANAADGAAGSWTATAADLVRLMAALDGLPNRMDILNATRITELDARAFVATGNQGVGWDSSSATRVEKNGNIGYGSSHLMRSKSPDRLTVAVVANSGANVTPLARQIYNAVQPLPDVSPMYDLFGLQVQLP